MKKIVLLAATFTFSLAMMAQKEAAKTKTQSVPTKLSATKSEVVKPVTADVPKAVQTQPPVQEQSQQSPDELIKVNATEHNFGKIPQGTPVSYSFELKNISNKPVVVENTSASCGCTTPEKITEPILPGATAKLKVQYNAAAVGAINKEVYVKLAGISQQKVLRLTGEVVAAEQPKPAN